MSKRKLEVWAVVGGGGLVELLYDQKTAESAAQNDRAYGIRDARAVRLVPYSPAKEKLAQAVGAWDKVGNPDWGPLLRRVRDAYQAVKRERRNK